MHCGICETAIGVPEGYVWCSPSFTLNVFDNELMPSKCVKMLSLYIVYTNHILKNRYHPSVPGHQIINMPFIGFQNV